VTPSANIVAFFIRQVPSAKIMRVLHVINSLILAGAEMLVHDLAPRLRARGLEVEVAVLRWLDSPLEAGLPPAGVPVHLLAEAGFYSLRQLRALARRASGFDLVHAHLFPAHMWTAMAGRLARQRPLLVMTEHGTWNRRRAWWFHAMDAWLYSQFDAVVSNSEATETALVNWVKGVRSKSCVIYNGIPLERFQEAQPSPPAELPGERQALRVISAARMEPQKDHATLLRAFARIPPGAELLLAGDGPRRLALESMARELGIAARVHFLGRRADVPQLLKACDVYVQCAHSEGFGIAALEAMAAGLPVIATDIPGLAQVVGPAGLLSPEGDADALARHLSTLLGSAELRQRMAARSRQRAQDFSIEACADAHVKLYQSLARRRAPARPSV
jgi:glycosyltransferase involved in cell wall biosynthesis